MSTAPAPAEDVAAAWAQYARLRSLYPSSNQRVNAAWEDLSRCLAAQKEPLVVALAGAKIRAGKSFLKVELGSNMAWLRDRLRTAGLDGVRFSPRLTRDALEEFTARLLELFRRGAGSLPEDERWPDRYEGIELVERRFAGGFGANAERAKIEAGGAGEGDSEGTGGGGGGGAEGPRDKMVRQLSVNGPVSERLSRISHHLSASGLAGRAAAAMAPEVMQRMLEYVVQCIPMDSFDNGEAALETAAQILGSVEEILGNEGLARLGDEEADPVALRALVYAASRRLFQRDPPKPREGVVKERERGRKGDDRVTDDLAELIGEVATLPFPSGDPLKQYGALLHPGEQLRMLMQLIASSQEAIVVQRAGEQLRGVLTDASPDQLLDMRGIIQEVWIEAEDPEVRNNLARFFREARLGSVLRACGMLTSATVIESFPQDLGLYLDSLDFSHLPDTEECKQTLAGISPDRIERRSQALIEGDESLLESGRIERLMSLDTRLVLPFLAVVLPESSPLLRSKSIPFLREHARNVAALAVLDVSQDASWLTGEFLGAIAASADGTPLPFAIQTSVANTLTDLAKDKLTPLTARVRSIQALGQLGRPGLEAVLLDLAESKKWFFFPREPLPVRAAARHALQQHRVQKALAASRSTSVAPSSHGSGIPSQAPSPEREVPHV